MRDAPKSASAERSHKMVFYAQKLNCTAPFFRESCPAMASGNVHPILMADDDENDAFFMEHAFGAAQIPNPLHRVKDGEEAVAYLNGDGPYTDREKFPLPHFLLLDLKMPRKNGFEVIQWVRQQPGLKRLPIIVLSSSREDPDINRAYELGANTYLVKPVRPEHLVELVKTLSQYWFNLAEQPDLSR